MDDNTVPRNSTVRKIADYFGVSVADLLTDLKEYHTKTTKTRAGTRTIKLFPAVVDALNAAKPDGAEPGNRITINPADITSRWRWVIKRAGVRQYRFHDLRHYLQRVF